MTRAIKFRVWNDIGMHGPYELEYIHQSEGYSGDYVEYGEYLQYTGLKDKNGVEIYEGDIILHPSGRCYKVEIPSCYELTWTGEISRVEVIGNIYENPELLEK